MAVAAANAATYNALVRELNGRADKQLDSSRHSVEKIKDVGYTKFATQLQRQAFAYKWEANILDPTEVALTEDEIEDDNNDDEDPDAIKRSLDRRNAYLIIMQACDGHPVENLIENIQPGNPRLLFDTVHSYFHPNTTAGLQTAYLDLFQSTMSSTGTTILGWVAHVARCAKIVRTSGGAADEGAELAVLIKGLLPEFGPLKLLLNQKANLTLRDAIATLMDFARSENLLELRKGGGPHRTKDNVFTVQVKPGESKPKKVYTQEHKDKVRHEPCYQWSMGNCRYGADCFRTHTGPSGAGRKPGPNPKASQHNPAGVPTATASQMPTECLLCHQSPSHALSDCPVAKSSNIDFSYMVGPTMDDKPIHPVADTQAFNWSEAVDQVLKKRKEDNRSSVYVVDGDPTRTDVPLQAMFGALIALLLFPATMGRYLLKDYGQVQGLRFVILILVLFAMFPQFAHSSNFNHSEAPSHARAFIIGQDDTSDSGGFEWVADTGTNRFVTNNLKDFLPETIEDVNINVGVGNGIYNVTTQGTIVIENHLGKTILCSNALYMPSCGKKLMPATPFLRNGCTLKMSLDAIELHTSDGQVLLTGKQIGELYYFKAKTIPPIQFNKRPTKQTQTGITPPIQFGNRATKQTQVLTYFGLPFGHTITPATADFAQKLLETHQAYGHLNFSKLRKLFGLKAGDDPHCPACAIAGSRKVPLKKIAERSTRINHRIHIDIGYTSGSQNPFQLYVDDFTRVSHLDLLTKKEEVLEYFIDLKNLLENQHAPWKFAYVRSDNEFVYTSNAWIQYCRDNGLEHEFSPPYRHDLMGVVERAMQVIGICFRCMMLQGNAPASMIPYALTHANTIRNHSPSKSNAGLTPLEKQAGLKLPINRRLIKGVLFCLVYIHIYEEQRIKHGDRSVPCVYMGFDSTNNQFIAMEWLTGKIHYCGDGTFMPTIFPFRSNPHKVPSWMNEHDHVTPSCLVPDPKPARHDLPTGPRRSYRPHAEQIHTGSVDQTVVPQESEEIRRSKRVHDYRHSVDALGNHIPVAEVADIISLAVDQAFTPELYYVHNWGPDPNNWEEAMSGPHAAKWIIAMLQERESFRQREVYVLVPRSEAQGHRIFKSRPVLKIKYSPPTPEEPNGSLEKFKYRLTIAAFTSMLIEGVDYKEKFASTVRWSALKLIISQAVQENWDLLHIDIKTFFLYGVLDEGKPVFMEQPPGWDTIDKPSESFVCLLHKSVYGHPAASHCAQKVLKATLTKDLSFKPTEADDCVYVSNENMPVYAVAGTHVDDILATGDTKGLLFLEKTLRAKFEITAKLNPTVITGVQIVRDRQRRFLKLHQGAYILQLLINFQMQDCNSVDTPMDPGTARELMTLSVDGTPDPVVINKFQTLIGCLLWLSKTRIDIAFATNLLTRFTRVATLQHLNLSFRVLRYLKGTIEFGIIFLAGFEDDGVLTGQADADLAGDLASSRSTSGSFLKVGRYGVVSYKSNLEKKISTSTGQAETYALAGLVKDTVWTRHLIANIRRPQKIPTELDTDNQGVHIQSTKAINHATAKHYRISQAYIREKGADGSVHVNKVGTTDNHADFLTKALCAELFFKHRDAVMGPLALQQGGPQRS